MFCETKDFSTVLKILEKITNHVAISSGYSIVAEILYCANNYRLPS